ncbi:alanine racemase [Mollicutes bacterium LVI A0039]|nr:alanine racemase [Mollicutes bacterium LVI A0039]
MNHVLKIDEQKVLSNIEVCRGDKQVCLMVKANTYGLGDEALQMLIDCGYEFFGVSTLEEALALRALSSSIKILIVSYIDIDAIGVCLEHDITFTVYDKEMIKHLDERAVFHLKIDTNMGRLGFQLDELEEVREMLVTKQLTPEGIFSHLACASDYDKTKQAIANFEYALEVFAQFNFTYIHIHNTYGSLNYDTSFDNLVRIGIGMWGYLANQVEAQLNRKSLKPALSLDLTISHVKQYHGFISYDHLDEVDGLVLTVPLGYHDGFCRKFRGYSIADVGVVVGNVNMCQHMILQTSETVYHRGDLYNLFNGANLYDLCAYGEITTYEFLVSLSPRIKRTIVK